MFEGTDSQQTRSQTKDIHHTPSLNHQTPHGLHKRNPG